MALPLTTTGALGVMVVAIAVLIVLNIKKGDNSADRRKPWIETPMLFAALGMVTLLFFVFLFYYLATLGIRL